MSHENVGRFLASRSKAHLRSLQSPAGWWKAPLDTNVTMDAEDLLMREFLGIRDEAIVAASARWIRSQQRADGTWARSGWPWATTGRVRVSGWR